MVMDNKIGLSELLDQLNNVRKLRKSLLVRRHATTSRLEQKECEAGLKACDIVIKACIDSINEVATGSLF